MKQLTTVFGLIAAILLAGCAERKAVQNMELSYAPGPHAVVYKTRQDYSNLVPIRLSEDRTQIVGYPDPDDLRRDGGLTLPIALEKGYVLDVQGIGPNVAFTSYTYEEYSRLPEPPLAEDMLRAVIDDQPLESMCDCGLLSQFENPVADLNRIIKLGKLKPCKELVGE